jgi:imidazolonepropionase-like amidohydrolase
MSRPPLEVADLIRSAGATFIERNRRWIRWQHVKVLLAIARCRARKHHLKIAFGDDDDPEFVAGEFGALTRGGMSPLQALQAATINGAELLGLSEQIGTVEPGKFADLTAVSGDPLTNPKVMERVTFVMKSGQIIRKEIATDR